MQCNGKMQIENRIVFAIWFQILFWFGAQGQETRTDFESFLDRVERAKNDTNNCPNLPHVNVFGLPCNFTLYNETSYARAWELADAGKYDKGADKFDEFVKSERCGKPASWRQAVCDAWPDNLFECWAKYASKPSYSCHCLITTQYKFKPENVSSKETACRVEKGWRCTRDGKVQVKALTCAKGLKCKGGICRGRSLFPPSLYFLLLLLCFGYISL